MKRSISLFIVGTALLAVSLSAQPDRAATAAAIAAQQEIEDRFRRVNSDVENLMAANNALQSRVTALAEEIRTLRLAQARAADDSAIQSELRRLADAIQEVDRKREADRKLILEQMGRLEKLLKTPPPASAPQNPAANAPAGPVAGFRYEVQPGDTLLDIIKHYNAEFRRQGLKTVTLQQTLDANPGLVPERMRVGQTIVIPEPSR